MISEHLVLKATDSLYADTRPVPALPVRTVLWLLDTHPTRKHIWWPC